MSTVTCAPVPPDAPATLSASANSPEKACTLWVEGGGERGFAKCERRLYKDGLPALVFFSYFLARVFDRLFFVKSPRMVLTDAVCYVMLRLFSTFGENSPPLVHGARNLLSGPLNRRYRMAYLIQTARSPSTSVSPPSSPQSPPSLAPSTATCNGRSETLRG